MKLQDALNIARKTPGCRMQGIPMALPKAPTQPIRFCLPFPPSVNNLYATVRGRRVKSKVGREFAEHAKREMKDVTQFVGPVAVRAWLYRPKKVGDLDNRLKGLLDCMTGLVYADDRQVMRIEAEWREDKTYPRAVVEIAPFIAADDAASRGGAK